MDGGVRRRAGHGTPMNSTFRQLRYFLVLAEELHFGRAARRLNISQPPLSASLRQLEEELGLQLLDRSSRSVRLTPAGKLFASRVAAALGQLDEAWEATREAASGAMGTLRIGFVPSMIFRGLPQMLKGFTERHPKVALELQELNSARQIARLGGTDREGRALDVGFIHACPLPDGMQQKVILDERFVCCVSHTHPLARRRRIALRDLRGETVLVFSRAHAAHYHDRIVGLLRAAEVEPDLSHEVSHWLTILSLVSQGIGVSLVPHCLVRSAFTDVAFLDVAEKDARHETCCIWEARTPSVTRDAFLDQVAAFYGSQVGARR